MDQTLYIGVDLGVRENVAFRADNEQATKIPFAPQKLKAWLNDICELNSATRPVVLLVESPQSPLVAAALIRGIQVQSINPLKASRFRAAITVANAKDDVRDARALVAFQKAYPQGFRSVSLGSTGLQLLRTTLTQRENVMEDTLRLANRLRQFLYLVFPALLVHSPKCLEKQWVMELLQVAPTSGDVHLIQGASVLKRLRKALKVKTDNEVRAILSENPSLPKRELLEGLKDHIFWSSQQLNELLKRGGVLRSHLEKQLKELEKQQQESLSSEEGEEPKLGSIAILKSFPAMGTIILASILSEIPQLEEGKLPDIKTLRAFSGVRPVTHQSGGRHQVVMRRARNIRLNNALIILAQVSKNQDQRCKMRYVKLKERGKKHQTALRISASSILDILYAMLRDKTIYTAKAVAA